MSDGPARLSPFRVRPRSLGGLRPGLHPDSIADLLEQVEGPPTSSHDAHFQIQVQIATFEVSPNTVHLIRRSATYRQYVARG